MDNVITTPRFPHYAENVPDELKAGERWVCCDEYKVPLIAIENGTIFAASSTNPDTWRRYETALASWQENDHIAGVGRVIAEDEDYAGVDLDDCVDPATGELSPWAATIVDRLDSYAEVSPSLKGVKIWVRAPALTIAYKKPGLEIYPRGRYFTFTGLVLGGCRREIREAGDELSAVIEEEFPKVHRDRTPYDGPEQVLDLDDFLERTDVTVFAVVSDGAAERKYRIRCPWLAEHSDGDESGTYTGQYENGALFFSCWHSHCVRRVWREFRHHVETLTFLGRAPRARRGRLR
jgi:hypothetical protein